MRAKIQQTETTDRPRHIIKVKLADGKERAAPAGVAGMLRLGAVPGVEPPDRLPRAPRAPCYWATSRPAMTQ